MCTLYASRVYSIIMHVCAFAFAAFGIGFALAGLIPHMVVIVICILLIEFGAFFIKRHKVVVDGDVLHLTPGIGRRRTVRLDEISKLKEVKSIGLIIYVEKKRVCTVSCDLTGYKQFKKMLVDNGYL